MLRVIGNLVAIFLLVYIGVYFGYGRLKQEIRFNRPGKTIAGTTSKVVTVTGRQAQVTSASRTQDYQVIVRRNIFHAALQTENKAPEKVEEDVVPTKLNLTLLGTVTGNDQDARAIIVDNNTRQQDLYQVGDAVQGAFIDVIKRGRVTLDVNGKREALIIKDREGGGPGAATGPDRAVSVGNTSPRPVAARKRPRVKPHRRISFRQPARIEDLEEGGNQIVEKEMPDKEPRFGKNPPVESDDGEELPVTE